MAQEEVDGWSTAELNKRAFNTIIPGRCYNDANLQINSITFSETGLQAIVSTNDDSIFLYDLSSGMRSRSINSKKYGASNVKFASEATCAIHASTKIDHTIRYLSLADNKYIRYYAGHEGLVTGISMSPKDDMFLSVSEDKTLRIWDLSSSSCLGLMELETSAVADFDSLGVIFAVASSGHLKLYDLRSYEKGPFSSFVVPNECSTDDWVSLRFSPCGTYILISTNTDKLLLLDAYTGTTKYILQGHQNKPRFPLKGSFAPDSKYVACGSSDKKIHVWSTESGEIVHTFNESPHHSPPLIVEWNPQFINFFSADKKLVLWNPVHEDMSNIDDT